MPIGAVLDAQAELRRGVDVDLVATRWTLLEAPRAAGARSLGAAVRSAHPNAALWVYAWHYLTHGPGDGLVGRARRTLPGTHGHLIDSEATRSAWETQLQLVELSGADGAILRTPPSFSPGARSRRALAAFAERATVALAWEPEGLWEPEDASALATSLGIRFIARGPVGRSIPGTGTDWALVEQAARGGALDAIVDGLAEGRTVLFAGDAYAGVRSARRGLRELA